MQMSDADLQAWAAITQAHRAARAGDRFRPLCHFLPPSGWMNDPVGLIHWRDLPIALTPGEAGPDLRIYDKPARERTPDYSYLPALPVAPACPSGNAWPPDLTG
jgi:sucrose-6-phosphate hydrolase SacC (GH32 family)